MKKIIGTDKILKKILIIGSNGFLGYNLHQIKEKKEFKDLNYFFIAADVEQSNIEENIPFHFIDITKKESFFKKIIKISPDIVILTAAMTNVDKCEKDKKLAVKINTEGPINVIRACNKAESKLIFVSTDFVFDGKKEGYYTEKDTPNPLNHYAKTKFDAEQALINSEIEYLICRTAVLYGWNSSKLNFITWVLKNLEQNKKIFIVKDQINSPTFVRNLAEIILKLIEKDIKGIIHTVGDVALSRYEIAQKCAEIFEFKNELIFPIDEFENITVNGNIILGGQILLEVDQLINASILPTIDNKFDIGSPS
ncbi:hypothetical protein LCGC14_1514600, partial [marine sediment metagenome]